MRVLVIGLDCATPEIVLGDERLRNLRQLMAAGCYGRLESVIPPITVPAWMCMATSRDPGSLGVYGFRNRTSHAYDAHRVVTSKSIEAPAIWDVLSGDGKQAVVIGVPPGYPPREINGVSIGCFLTPDPVRVEFTHPVSIKQTIRDLVGDYPVDVSGFRTNDKSWLRDQIYEMTRKHFQVVRHLMTTIDWEYFQFVEIGLDRIQHGFWKYCDASHRQYEPGNAFEDVIGSYYAYLDDEIGQTLKLVDDRDVVLVVSDHGAQRLDGGFCINEWLMREGLLRIRDRPARPTPLKPDNIDWNRTQVWSEGGYCARVFVNLAGREPAGVVEQSDYEALLDRLTNQLESLPDDRGASMGTRVFQPREIYRQVNRVPPDLIVHFGQLLWRSVGSVGYESLYVQENDTGPDDCNHAQFGVFILRGPRMNIHGQVEGMHLLDVAPTLLDVAGRDVPAGMQGRSLLRWS